VELICGECGAAWQCEDVQLGRLHLLQLQCAIMWIYVKICKRSSTDCVELSGS
jgi:hypothetical protein